MKTVRDYLDLGLMFIDGDKICGVTGDSSSNKLDIFDSTLCTNKYSKGASKIGVDCYARARWTPSSFAWRNNDGVKPEYKGVIEVECESSNIRKGFVSDFMYWWHDGTIIKWRPVVLQSDDANKKIQEKFLSVLRSDSRAFKNAELIEPPSSTTTVNIEGRDYIMVSRTPTVSPKENKPMKQFKTTQEANAIVADHIESMKPVYTSEMHAKGERPQVGSEAALRYKFDSKQIHIIGKVLYASMEHCIIDGEHKECHYKMCDYTYEPIIKTIKVNGFDVPAPMSEAPENGSVYFTASINKEYFFCEKIWENNFYDHHALHLGFAHSTKSAAIAHAKAMIGIDPTKDAK